MGNLHIVTGYRGQNHVTAADVGSFQAAIFGEGNYVLNRGNRFAASVISNNQIRVQDGDLLMQGRHIRMNEGTYIDLTIENGTQSYLRNDLIVARYTKDSSTGVEDVNLVVIKGTAVASNPTDPEHTIGDIINDHVYLCDMPLYRVPLDGLNVQTLVPLYSDPELVTGARKVNNKPLSTDINLTANDVSAIPTSMKGMPNGVASLTAYGRVTPTQRKLVVAVINNRHLHAKEGYRH